MYWSVKGNADISTRGSQDDKSDSTQSKNAVILNVTLFNNDKKKKLYS